MFHCHQDGHSLAMLLKCLATISLRTSAAHFTFLHTVGAHLVSQNSEIVTQNSDLLSQNSDIVSQNSDLLSQNSDLLSQNSDLVS